MKRFPLILVSLLAVFSGWVRAQSLTPNLHLNLPAQNAPNWHIPLNANFSLLDSFLSGGAALPGLNIAVSGTNCTRALKLTNTDASPSNPNKYFRINALTGALELVNSVCSQTIFSIDDTGNIFGPAGGPLQTNQPFGIYGGKTTAGLGLETVVYAATSAAANANVSATTMLTTPATSTFCPAGLTVNCGVYEVTSYIDVAAVGTSCTGTTTVVSNIIFTDPLNASTTTYTSSALTVAASGNGTLGGFVAFGSVVLVAKAGTPIQYSFTNFTAGAGCSPAPKFQVTNIVKQVS
jgi:hypothetical protein